MNGLTSIEELTERLQKTLHELTRLKEEHEETKDNARYLDLTNRHLQEQLTTLQDEIHKQSKELSDQHEHFTQMIHDKNLECTAIRNELDSKQAEITVLSDFLHRRNDEYEHVVQEFTEYKESEHERLDDARVDVSEEVARHRSEKEMILKRSEQSQTHIVSLEETNDVLHEEIRELSAHVYELQHEIEILRQHAAEDKHEIETLNAQMNERNEYIHKLEVGDEQPVRRLDHVSAFASESMSLLRSFLRLPPMEPKRYDPVFKESDEEDCAEDDVSDYADIPDVLVDSHVERVKMLPTLREKTPSRPIMTRNRWCGVLLAVLFGLSGFLLGYTCNKKN